MTTPTVRVAATGAALALLGSLVPSAGATSSESTQRAAGVCSGVENCRRVAAIDVDGDHRPDRVGWRKLGKKYAQVRVHTADGESLAHKVEVRFWPGGGAWGDAAWIDGRPGAELLVGSVMGAHTPQYTMLTYRKRQLVVERSPGGGIVDGRWTVDSALMVNNGWTRKVGEHGRITMTRRDAWRNDSGKGFKGHNIRYAWTRGHWKRLNRKAHSYANAKQAQRIAGWHVGHLKRWPGLR